MMIMKAPDFSLKDSSGNERRLSEFDDRIVVLYFYPKDNTPGCTIEALDFTAKKGEFSKLGAIVLGISKDSCDSHRKFMSSKDLDLILLSDPDSEVQKKYGVWKPKKFMGREFLGTVRSTFLIKDGMIVKKWENVKVQGHADEVLAAIQELI